MFCSGVELYLRSLGIRFMAVLSMHGTNDRIRNPVVAGTTKFTTTKITSEDLLQLFTNISIPPATRQDMPIQSCPLHEVW